MASQRGAAARTAIFWDFMNILKSFIGSNYLVMPFAYTQGGLVLGTVALFFVGALTDRCCSQLVACKRKVVAEMILHEPPPISEAAAYTRVNELHARVSFGETARIAFGDSKVAEAVVEGALAFTQLGFCIDYFVFVISSLKSFSPSTSKAILALVPFAFLAPCALMPSVKSLAPISAVANAAILSGFVCCLVYETQHLSFLDPSLYQNVPWANWSKFPVFLSIAMS